MFIAGLNTATNSLSQLRKDLSDEAQQKQLDNQSLQEQRKELSRREQFADEQANLNDRGIEASAEAARATRQQRLGDLETLQESNLPRQNQVAIQAFVDSSPSPEEQLGIELAGIDTYA
jgi:hypothetical protein